MNAMQAMIVRFVGRWKRFEILGQMKAPKMPDDVAVMDRSAIWTVPIFSSVRAKRIAVPETVAMASESRNHARRNMRTCLSFKANFMVWKSDIQANFV